MFHSFFLLTWHIGKLKNTMKRKPVQKDELKTYKVVNMSIYLETSNHAVVEIKEIYLLLKLSEITYIILS